MTHAKKLKKQIRARALRTGESYVTARRHVLSARVKPAPKLGIADDKVVKATGHGLDHWFGVLDKFGKGHKESAAHLLKNHGLRAWWAQMVTVMHERARGRRVRNQSCAGTFQVNVSKAIGASVGDVLAAFSDGRWLAGADPELARAFPKSAKPVQKASHAKLRYRWGAGTVEIRVSPKKGGCTVVADNMKLADAAEVEKRRTQWRGAFAALKADLGT